MEMGKAIALTAAVTLVPYAGLSYLHSERDGFTETGAGSANLSVGDASEDSLRSTLGLRLSRAITTRDNHRITPYLDAAYVREYLDSVSRLDAGFSVVPAAVFRIDGSDLDRDRMQLGAGVYGQWNDNTTLQLGYAGELAGSDQQHTVAGTVSYRW